MSIIIDTSIWIEFFRGKTPYYDLCSQLIDNREIHSIEIVFAELFQGAKSEREIILLKNYFNLIPKIEIKNLSVLAGEYSCYEKLYTKGIGLIDSMIVYSTIATKSKLWTLDKKILNYLSHEYLLNA